MATTGAGMSRAGGPIGLDELIALNDEIAALSRAGLPLERGLLGFGSEVPGRLGSAAAGLAERLERGEGLAEARRDDRAGWPPTSRAAVEAGLRSGRLAAALEDLAAYARGFAELRRAVGLAFLYPVMVLLLAWVLFAAFVVRLLPRLIAGFEGFRLTVPAGARWLAGLGDSAWLWAPIVPAIVAMLGLAWVWSGRAKALRVGPGLRWVPWLRGILADWRASNFAGWLALLIEHGVPLDEAVELAADAAGDPKLAASGRAIAEAVRRGETAGASLKAGAEGLPPLLCWMVLSGESRGTLAPALRHAAETYRLRALHRAETLRTTLPTLLLLGIGGLSALLYALALFGPWTQLLDTLARPRM